jgi:hypothetical protein
MERTARNGKADCSDHEAIVSRRLGADAVRARCCSPAGGARMTINDFADTYPECDHIDFTDTLDGMKCLSCGFEMTADDMAELENAE